MRRNMDDLRDRLSKEIFSRRYVDLDECQRAFVDYHVGGYQTYVSKVAPEIRQALQKTKLNKEYDNILEMYCLRLPPEYFRDAVEEGVKKAKDREAITYAAGWFKDHFRRHIERYRKHVSMGIGGRIEVDVDYPWFFNIFRYIRENDTDFIFDSFWGFREKKKRKKKKRSVEIQLVLKIRENNSIDYMIKSLEEFKGRYHNKKGKIKTLKRRKKRVLQQIDELKGRVENGLSN
jgi:hypothetical protein